MSCCCGFCDCSPNEAPGLPTTGSTPVAGVPCVDSPSMGNSPSSGVTASTSSSATVSKFWDAELPYIKGLFGLEGSATFGDFYNGTKSNLEAYYGWTLVEVALIVFVFLVLAVMLVHYVNE